MKKIIIGIAVAVFMLTGCNNKKSSADASGALPIEVAEPVVKNVTLTKDYPGTLDADRAVELVARVNGYLDAVYFNPGQRVKKGQLLMLIEPTLYQDQVKQAQASLKTAEANLSYANSNYVRMKEAIKSDAVSRIQYLQAESNVATCEAAVSSAKAALNVAQTNLSYCYLRSPFDGVIDVNAYPIGSYLSGSASPVKLATVYKDNIMFAYFNVADNQFISFKMMSDNKKNNGNDNYVTLSLGSDSTFSWKAKLDYLSPDVTLSTGTLMLRATLENPDGFLRPGMYVSVNLPYGEKKDAVLVSDQSIGTDQLGKYLYVVNDSNIVNYRPIKTGQLIANNMRIVNSGLAPNEKYVTKALLKVRQGMKIQPIMQPSEK